MLSSFPSLEFGWARKTAPLLKEMGVTDTLDLRKDTLEYARLVGGVRNSAYGPRVLRMIDAILSGELRVEPGLDKILDGVTRPLHFLDFESWNPALPVFPGTRPYQQLPFQWSTTASTMTARVTTPITSPTVRWTLVSR